MKDIWYPCGCRILFGNLCFDISIEFCKEHKEVSKNE